MIIVLSISGFKTSAQTYSTSKNYILEQIIKNKGYTSETQLVSKPVDSVFNTIRYFDGLGRPSQTIRQQWTDSTKKDFVQYFEYDNFGREQYKYLPYASTNNNGLYISTAKNDLKYFYNNQANVAHDTVPWVRTIYDNSPINRPLKIGGPGAVWKPDPNISADDHSVKYEYKTNSANDVLLFIVDATGQCKLTAGQYFSANTLVVSVAKDENWASSDWNNRKVMEFIDKLGRVILKRNFTDGNTYNTYYVYDDFNNLRFVLPPEAIHNFTPAPNAIISNNNQYIFVYKYDARNRMNVKIIPGADSIYMIYDFLDRLVLTQDGELRSLNKWKFIKYDALNRPVSTGVQQITGSRTTVQNAVNSYYISNPFYYFENITGITTSPDHGYTDHAYPTGIADTSYLTVTYYDDYGFISNTTNFGYPVSPPSPYNSNVKLASPKGHVTGSYIKNHYCPTKMVRVK